MDDIVEMIHSLLYNILVIESPVLSGSMKSMIQSGMEDPSTRELIIDAPFYDVKRWEKDRTIVYTGDVIQGRTAYAEWVNRLGGFGTHNKSEEWVNRAVHEVVDAIANGIGATVYYEI